MDEVVTKKCRHKKCRHKNTPQPLENFYKSTKTVDGYDIYCKDCRKQIFLPPSSPPSSRVFKPAMTPPGAIPEFKIEKDIPIPALPRDGGARLPLPLQKCVPGDSFLVPTALIKPLYKNTESFRSVAARNARRIGCKVRTGIEKDGVRVWLVECRSDG